MVIELQLQPKAGEGVVPAQHGTSGKMGSDQIDNYASKIAIGLGILHTVIGVIAMVFTGTFYHDDTFNNVSNGWGWGFGSVLFMVSGSLAIAGGCKTTKNLIIATFVLSVVSAIAAFSLFAYSIYYVAVIFVAAFSPNNPENITFFTRCYLGILLVLIMVIVATISSVLAAKVVLSSRDKN